MKEQLISFKTAKLAKEKGFELTTASTVYDKEGVAFDSAETINITYQENNAEKYYAPTQSLLQKWLREEKRLDTNILYSHDDKVYKYAIIPKDGKKSETRLAGGFITYEEAFEAGLQEALKLIK